MWDKVLSLAGCELGCLWSWLFWQPSWGQGWSTEERRAKKILEEWTQGLHYHYPSRTSMNLTSLPFSFLLFSSPSPFFLPSFLPSYFPAFLALLNVGLELTSMHVLWTEPVKCLKPDLFPNVQLWELCEWRHTSNWVWLEFLLFHPIIHWGSQDFDSHALNIPQSAKSWDSTPNPSYPTAFAHPTGLSQERSSHLISVLIHPFTFGYGFSNTCRFFCLEWSLPPLSA